MAKLTSKKNKSRARPLADLIGQMLDPICAKRGFGSASLLSFWPDIVGQEYESVTLPEEIKWPRRRDQPGADEDMAVLTVRVAPAHALYFQHECPQILERVNMFLGYRAIGRIRIVQGAIPEPKQQGVVKAVPLNEEQKKVLDERVQSIESEDLEASLKTLGAAVLFGKKNK